MVRIRKPVTEYDGKMPAVEKKLAELERLMAETQETLFAEADVMAAEYKKMIRALSRQHDFKNRRRYEIRVAKTDNQLVQAEWILWKYNPTAPKGKRFQPYYIARGKSMSYDLARLSKGKGWEYPYIVDAEPRLGYVRLLSRMLRDMKDVMDKARIRGLSDIAENAVVMKHQLLEKERLGKTEVPVSSEDEEEFAEEEEEEEA